MIFELSILFAFGAMLCWGIGDFLIQRTVRKVGDVETLAFIGIIGGVLLLPFIIYEKSTIFTIQNLLLLLVLGVITFVVALFNFEALKRGKLAVVDVILELELPVTIILSYVFFKEKLSGIQFFIIAFIFIGLILMALKTFKKDFWKGFEKGLLLAVITALGMGLVNFFTAVSSKNISPFMAIWLPWIIFTIFCFIVIIRRGELKKFSGNFMKFKTLIIFMGIFDTLAWLFYALAVVQNDVAVTTAITESYPAIALFLGLWLNKERIKKHQYIGAGLALIASVALAFLI